MNQEQIEAQATLSVDIFNVSNESDDIEFILDTTTDAFILGTGTRRS